MSGEGKPTYSGHLLKEARKKKRRRYRKLSSELGIPENYLKALEDDDYSSMAGPTYVKGYLRAYSKKLDLDPEVIIRAYERYIKDQRKEEKAERRKETPKTLKLAFITLIITIIFLAFITLFIFYQKNDLTSGTLNESSNDLNQELLENSEEEILYSIDTKHLNQDTLILEKEGSIKSKDLLNIDNKKNSLNDLVLINRIKLTIYDDCWVEIMDQHSILEYRLAKAGTLIEIEGKGPYKIVLGNSQKAELLYNGKQVNLSATTNTKTNVSCLVLPTGRCSEFTLSN